MISFRDYRDDLSNNHSIETCLYCQYAPRFHQWPDRELVIFEHKCKFFYFERTMFPNFANKAIQEWNDGITIMKNNLIKPEFGKEEDR